MVAEVRIYIEGGGDGNSKAMLRQGFSSFLKELVDIARGRMIRWNLIACGGRDAAFDNFITALRTHQGAFNVLLVDSEGPVNLGPRQYLQERDRWDLGHVPDDQCYLMVQLMESWLITDAEALREFYGQGFNANALPNNPNVEQVAKTQVMAALENATRRTRAGSYHKTRHGPRILALVEVAKVRQASYHCGRLFDTLTRKMNEP